MKTAGGGGGDDDDDDGGGGDYGDDDVAVYSGFVRAGYAGIGQ